MVRKDRDPLLSGPHLLEGIAAFKEVAILMG